MTPISANRSKMKLKETLRDDTLQATPFSSLLSLSEVSMK